jgi:hypothetical protein
LDLCARFGFVAGAGELEDTTASMSSYSSSVAVSGSASTYLELKTLSPLFSIAPMLKSLTATIM